ncbi:LLM class flavin-dependent oxidoreductase [Asaia spathodeae]|uniref:LLM class flavin-dependent oxidoreductase n=1 Tax=Asaia spathodeae TaxID=657016 RepID=UPI002FC2F332
MTPLSILDLSLIRETGSAADALSDSRLLAQKAEMLGFQRYWVAEHHGMPGIASAATSVVIGALAAATSRIRVGAGGIMLPNHAPLVIAEQFGTLDALYPGRIDLGLGRAPGSDQRTLRALRRNREGAERFPQEVLELMAYFAGDDSQTGILATPGAGADIPIWLLGSSLFSAELAAALGLPFAFASHFAPQMMEEAIALYREGFRPSSRLAAAHVMLAMNIVAADTHEEADYLATSRRLYMAALRQGTPGRFPHPVAVQNLPWGPEISRQFDEVLSTSFVGTVDDVAAGLSHYVERHRPDEIMMALPIYDLAPRLHALDLAREAARRAGLG